MTATAPLSTADHTTAVLLRVVWLAIVLGVSLELLVLLLRELVEEQAMIGASRSAGIEKIRRDMVAIHSEIADLIACGEAIAAQERWAGFLREATNTVLRGARQKRVGYAR